MVGTLKAVVEIQRIDRLNGVPKQAPRQKYLQVQADKRKIKSKLN